MKKIIFFVGYLFIFLALAQPCLASVTCSQFFHALTKLSSNTLNVHDLNQSSNESVSVKFALKQMLHREVPYIYPGFSNQMPFTVNYKDALDFFNQPIYQFFGKISQDTSLGVSRLKKERLSLFESTFQVVPIHFFEITLNHELGIPQDTNLFLMKLSLDSFQSLTPSAPTLHISAFAYLRFNIRDGNIFITEIQNDYYSNLSAEHKIKYANWSRVLMMSFEQYALSLISKNILTSSSKIIFADDSYQKKRWPKIDNGFSIKGLNENLARMLYRDLPKWLGYRKSQNSFEGFDWTGHVDFSSKILAIEKPWEITLEELQQHDRLKERFSESARAPVENLRRSFSKSFQVFEQNVFESLIKNVPTSFLPDSPKNHSPYKYLLSIDSKNLTASILEHPTTPQSIYSDLQHTVDSQVLPEMKSLSLNSLYPSLLLRIGVPYSEDRTHALHFSSSLEKMRTLDIFYDSSPWVLSVKGSGIFQKDLEIENFRFVDKEGEGIHIPFREQETDGDLLESHQYFGGLSFKHAILEFQNALALHKLYKEFYGTLAPTLVPFRIYDLDFLPVYQGTELHWYPRQEYYQKFFKNLDVELVQYHYFSHSELRISQIQKLIIANSSLEIIHSTLNRIYKTYGYDLILPTSDFKERSHLDQPTLLKHLSEIYKLNSVAAEKILEIFYKNSLTVMGLVHGKGGHLGGLVEELIETETGETIYLKPAVGAIAGGATAPRNINVHGEVFDLDSNIYFPWTNHSDVHPMQRYVVDKMRIQDVKSWNISAYFLEVFLRGRTDVEKTFIDENLMGDPKFRFVLTVVPYGSNYQKEWDRAPVQPLESRLVWNRKDLNKIYEDAFHLSSAKQ